MRLINLDNLERSFSDLYNKVKAKFATKDELNSGLNKKADKTHGTHLDLGTTSTTAARGDYGYAGYTHSQTAHAPSNAQKNSDITKTEIENKLTGTITTHNHSGTYAPASHGTHLTLGTGSGNAYRGDYGNTAYTHSQAAHAPSNAQKNSDITKTEIENKLTGTITTHAHNYAGSSSAGGAANSVQYPLTFRYRGYTTNSYDGSTSRTLDLNAEMIGAAPGGYSEITTGDTKGWYRIARTPAGFGSVLGDFIITASVSNVDSNIKITAGVSQTTRPLLQQLGNTYNVAGVGCITKARIVYDNTFTGMGAYLEVYSDFDGPVTLYVQLFGGNVGGGSIGNDMQYYSRWHLYSGTSTVQVDNPGTNYKIKELTLKELKMIADFEGTFNGFSFWSGTQSQYDAIATKDPTTVYMIIN